MNDILKPHFHIEHLTNVSNSVSSSLRDAAFRLNKFTCNIQAITDQLPFIEIGNQNPC